MSTPKTLDLQMLMNPDAMGSQIADMFLTWDTLRRTWLDEKRELRNYIFATDTRKTTNSQLPWKNSTTLPKLCQIRDNLHANYMAALFPSRDWLEWEGDTEDAVSKQKAKTIESFVENKCNTSGFEATVSQLVLDWIDFGNLFGTVEFVNETTRTDNEEFPGYVGPKLTRISPYDIVFDPTAISFEKTPKIIRSIKTLGILKKEMQGYANQDLAASAFKRATELRKALNGVSAGDSLKDNGFTIDGFGSYQQYFNSGMIEVLEFYGDLYDVDNDKLYENHIITVVDRCYILRLEPNKNWLGKDNFFHQGWRVRPDNLYAMGPLDNLVGMQYRIDHLENLKADAFDMVAFPMMKIRGDVEAFTYAPNEKIYVGDEGDVEFMHPDVAALAADNQIAILEQKMEELAGAPKEAMGIRTPGEKTAFEVQSLQNSASRIFQNKTLMLERGFLTNVLNAMLEVGIRNMATTELIKTMDSELDIVTFRSISKDDIKASGKLYPMGASHFAQRALLIQNITQLLSTPVGQDPAVTTHISGLGLARTLEEALDLEKFQLVRENVRVMEQMQTQRLVNDGREQLAVEQQTSPGITQGDPGAGAPPSEGAPL